MSDCHNVFQHRYLHKRNTVSAWSGYDSPAQWQINIRESRTREMLARWNWLPFVELEYRYNSHAFRDEEFYHGQCGIALGCSFTEGVGVAEDQTWPRQLEKLVGYKVWNLGIGGTGISTCYRAMEYFLPQLRPKFVALLPPPIARLEILGADGKFTHLLNVGWQNSDVTSPHDQFVKHWFSQEFNWIQQHRVFVRAMKHIAAENSVCFIDLYNGPVLQPDPDYKEPPDLFVDRARDLAHAGPVTLKKTAQMMFDLLTAQGAV